MFATSVNRTRRTGDFLERRNKMNMMTSYKNWRNYRSTVAELSGLSNRDLADIGIARANIRDAARKAVR
jgi:uncharacterized protein YjiS (DUF1127 family)